MATYIAAHFALCHVLMKNQKICTNRCLVFFNGLFLFCSVILSLLLFCLINQGRIKGESLSTVNKLSPQVILLLAVPRGLFCFGSLVSLVVVCRYLSLFSLYIYTKIGKNIC